MQARRERMMKARRRHSFWVAGGVHLREHRNCLEQLSLPATGRILRDAERQCIGPSLWAGAVRGVRRGYAS